MIHIVSNIYSKNVSKFSSKVIRIVSLKFLENFLKFWIFSNCLQIKIAGQNAMVQMYFQIEDIVSVSTSVKVSQLSACMSV